MKTISAPALTIRASTIGQLIQADGMAVLQKRLGLAALIDLIEDTVAIKVKHGIAAETAAILKEGGLPAARAKYYSEKAAQCCAALQLQGVLTSSKARGTDAKAEAYNASIASNLAMLASMASILQAQKWAKENGPKADKADDKADDKAALPIGPTFAFPGNPEGVFQMLAAMAASIWFSSQKAAFKAAQKAALSVAS